MYGQCKRGCVIWMFKCKRDYVIYGMLNTRGTVLHIDGSVLEGLCNVWMVQCKRDCVIYGWLNDRGTVLYMDGSVHK